MSSDTDARMDVESVREKIGGAGLLDITTPAFRLYRTADDRWRWSLVEDDGWTWRLVDGNGEPLAESVRVHDTRRDAREEMLAVKDRTPSGETRVTW